MRLIVDFPYAEGVHQLVQQVGAGLSQMVPGINVEIIDTQRLLSQQGEAVRGLETASTPHRPLTRPTQAGPPPGLPGPPSGPGMPADPRLAQRDVGTSPFARRRV
jgi:hypothetical protein